jgi:hypothetical protein
MDARGGTGKTLISHDYRLTLASLRYQLIFGDRTPQRLPRPVAKRPPRIKNSTALFRRY